MRSVFALELRGVQVDVHTGPLVPQIAAALFLDTVLMKSGLCLQTAIIPTAPLNSGCLRRSIASAFLVW